MYVYRYAFISNMCTQHIGHNFCIFRLCFKEILELNTVIRNKKFCAHSPFFGILLEECKGSIT